MAGPYAPAVSMAASSQRRGPVELIHPGKDIRWQTEWKQPMSHALFQPLQDQLLELRLLTLRNPVGLEDCRVDDFKLTLDRVVAAACLAGAHDFILELAEGYDTIVGERGSTLSGGQRQRIAIARALVTDPRILIFDEATSALDYESERVIQRNMKEIARGRTVLIVAHRLSTVRAADRIVTLDRGRLVEDGTHDTLIKTGGRYASLHRLQGGFHEVG